MRVNIAVFSTGLAVQFILPEHQCEVEGLHYKGPRLSVSSEKVYIKRRDMVTMLRLGSRDIVVIHFDEHPVNQHMINSYVNDMKKAFKGHEIIVKELL